MNVESALRTAAGTLDQAGIVEPRREAASLLAFILKTDRAFLIAHPEHELTADKSILFKSVVKRRSNREPFQHIVGSQEFYGLEFRVTPDVLVPRPETELLVETAINHLSTIDSARLLEIGVGSGCIAVSILHNVQTATAIGVDISHRALKIAEENTRAHNVDDRIELLESSVYRDIPDGKFHAIVSNPPYIPVADFETLQQEVRDFDPRIALTDEGDGLSIISSIISGATSRLEPKGRLYIEIGQGQDASVREMFGYPAWDDIEVLPDLQGIPRVACATYAGQGT